MQNFNLGSQCGKQLAQSAGNISATVNDRQQNERFGLHVKEQDMLSRRIALEHFRRKTFDSRQQRRILLNQTQSSLDVRQILRGNPFPPLLYGIRFDRNKIGKRSLGEVQFYVCVCGFLTAHFFTFAMRLFKSPLNSTVRPVRAS